MAKQRKTDHGARAPADDDALAFRAAVRDVKPLAHTPSAQGLAKPRSRTRPATALIDIPPMNTNGDAAPGDAVTGADNLSFQRAGVRTQVVRRLRRGLIPIEDELDLHGLSQSAARDQLAQFLAYSRAAGRRCVRIIHGKGYRSGARGPVLKIAVDLWLRHHLDVMAFTSAKTIDGGTGAVYVLLRA
ncbi:MAG TPA: Smr/MutS family protein [Steroidobacteraceae bacterium]|jgi:DNA-nicking Smr family endonuclease